MEPDESFREFVEARGTELSRAAFLLAGEQTIARDLLRTALAKALKQWERLRNGGDPEGFVRQSMLSATWLWWRYPRRPGEFATAALPDHPVEAAEQAEASHLVSNAVLAAVLPRLRRRQRVVLYLRFAEDTPEPEVARQLNTSGANVAKQLRAAIQRARRLAPGVLRVPEDERPQSWEEYRRFADSITSFAAADDAMVAIGRNRRVGAAVACIPLALILLIAASALWDGGFTPSERTKGDWQALGPITELPSPDPTPLVPIDDWRRPPNEPVPIGTLIEGERDSSCGFYDGCHLYLRTRDGVRLSVESLLPNLSRRRAPSGLSGASWSPNGAWLGLSSGQTYEFHSFSDGQLIRLPSGPVGSFWEPIGWAADSAAAFLIRIEDERIAEYLVFDAVRGGYESFRPDGDFTMRPVGVGRNGDFLVAKPINGYGPAVGRFRLWTLNVSGSAPEGSSERVLGQSFDLDVRKYLRKGESIAGPSGVPKLLRPVLGDHARAWVTVFARHNNALVPSAVLHLGDSDADTVRIDLPRDEREGNWTLLGPLGGGIAMLYEPTVGDSEVVQFSGLGRQSVQYVPEDADVLLPGMSG